MKNFSVIVKILLPLCLASLLIACGNDETSSTSQQQTQELTPTTAQEPTQQQLEEQEQIRMHGHSHD